jgi:hypothetical protein
MGDSETEEVMEVINEVEENQAEVEHEVEQEILVEENQETNTRSSSKRSWVWAYFTYDKTVERARCNSCKALIVCNKGSTSGLSTHLGNKHKIKKETKDKGKKQLTLPEVVKNCDTIVCILESIHL